MRTLHLGLRVSDLARSLAFYEALGYEVIGAVPGTGLGDLTMLALPDDPHVSIELVHASGQSFEVGGMSHLVIQVESLDESSQRLEAAGIAIEDVVVHDSATGFATAWLTDPDGYRIELVQWPAGHPVGMTRADFPARS